MTAFEHVARYAAGLLDDQAAADLERRMFEDTQLRAVAAFVLDLVEGLRELAAHGPLVPVVTPAELDALASSHRILAQRAQDGVVSAQIDDDFEFVAGRLPIDLRAATRIDVGICPMQGPPYFVVREAPFDPESGEIVVLCKTHVARAAGRIRVVITDERDRKLGEFILDNR